MKFGEIDIPKEILEAQEENKLVIFAGAGVSKPPPSCLPDFDTIAQMVEDKFGLKRKRKEDSIDIYDEPIEVYLGRVEDGGHNVHDFVSRIFKNTKSKPNDLHKNIIRLFKDKHNIQLVTTNYDLCFKKAARELGLENYQEHYAPALPPGDGFKGTSYIHGSIAGEPKWLIMTDKDFGKAYLTQGWARRFLLSMFQNRIVLFVGYRHDDTVLQYLSRALPLTTSRFAMSNDEETSAKWRFLRITPILTDTTSKDKFYSRQSDCLQKWADFTQSDYTMLDNRMRTIVEEYKPPIPEDEDLIKYCFARLDLARFFIKWAEDIKWLYWLNDHKIVAPLFQNTQTLSQVEQKLSNWICKKFVVCESDSIFEILEKNGGTFNPFFWRNLVWQLTNNKERPEPLVLSKWVTLLIIGAPQEILYNDSLEYLLNKCRYPDDNVTAVMLLGYLLSPIIILEKYFFAYKEKKKVDYKLTLRGSDHWLNEIWKKFFFVKLEDFWRRLLPIVQGHLSLAYSLNLGVEKAYGDEDTMSLYRLTIEDSQQNWRQKSFDILIDAGRDILEHVLDNHPEEGINIINSWIKLDAPLLRRIAIHGVGYGKCYSPIEKISWLLKRDLILNYWFSHEVYLALKQAFEKNNEKNEGKIDDATIENLVSHIREGQVKEIKDEDIKIELKFTLIDLIYQYAPEVKAVKDALNAIVEGNPHFKTKFDRETGSIDEEETTQMEISGPILADDLGNKKPEQWVDYIITFERDERRPGRDRYELMNELSKAVSSSFNWGISLAELLIARKEWKGDVWRAIFRGFGNLVLSAQQWQTILGLIKGNSQLYSADIQISDLFEISIKKEANGLPFEILDDVDEISDTLWNSYESLPAVEIDEYTGWLGTAINHAAGKLVEYWIQSLYKRQIERKEKWKSLPLDYRRRFEKVMKGKSFSAGLGRCVLSSRFHYFCDIDLEWTKANMLPLFDFANNSEYAEQAWNGMLFWGKLPLELFEDFEPLILSAVNNLSENREGQRERLYAYVIDPFLTNSLYPAKTKWLYQVLSSKKTSDENRVFMVHRIWDRLRDADDDYKKKLWNNWLKSYWLDRIENKPIALSKKEKENMIKWMPYLQPVFPDVVEVVLKMDISSPEYTSLYTDIREKGLAAKYPDAVNKLLTHVLRGNEQESWHCYELNPIFDILNENLAEDKLKALLNHLKRLGCR